MFGKMVWDSELKFRNNVYRVVSNIAYSMNTLQL